MTATPIYTATALHLAGTYGKQAVRAGFRDLFPRCGCGRFLTRDGGCGRCDKAVVA